MQSRPGALASLLMESKSPYITMIIYFLSFFLQFKNHWLNYMPKILMRISLLHISVLSDTTKTILEP